MAGMDMTMAGDQGLGSGDTFWGTNLTDAVLNGTIPQWRLDDMCVRIMSAFYKVGRDTARVPINFSSWTLVRNILLSFDREVSRDTMFHLV